MFLLVASCNVLLYQSISALSKSVPDCAYHLRKYFWVFDLQNFEQQLDIYGSRWDLLVLLEIYRTFNLLFLPAAANFKSVVSCLFEQGAQVVSDETAMFCRTRGTLRWFCFGKKGDAFVLGSRGSWRWLTKTPRWICRFDDIYGFNGYSKSKQGQASDIHMTDFVAFVPKIEMWSHNSFSTLQWVDWYWGYVGKLERVGLTISF